MGGHSEQWLDEEGNQESASQCKRGHNEKHKVANEDDCNEMIDVIPGFRPIFISLFFVFCAVCMLVCIVWVFSANF